MNQKIAISLLGVALLTVLGFWTLKRARAEASASSLEVRIDNFTFQAQTLTVPIGSEVTWINRDDIPHTVVSTDQVFKSKALDSDDKFTYKFTQTGTYKYFCSIHPKMTGEIIVK